MHINCWLEYVLAYFLWETIKLVSHSYTLALVSSILSVVVFKGNDNKWFIFYFVFFSSFSMMNTL